MNELSQFVEKKAMVQVEGDWQFLRLAIIELEKFCDLIEINCNEDSFFVHVRPKSKNKLDEKQLESLM